MRWQHAIVTCCIFIFQLHADQLPTTQSLILSAPTTSAPEATPYNDNLRLTFILLICCIIQLNLPAIFFSLIALNYSMKVNRIFFPGTEFMCCVQVRELNAAGRCEESRKYTTIVLICNSLAVLEYILLIIGVFMTLMLYFILKN